MMDISKALADRVTPLKASAIREIFKMLGKPGIISFAGGIPSPELFPTEDWGRLFNEIAVSEGSKAFVYGVTEGYPPLAEKVKKINEKNNVGKDFDRTAVNDVTVPEEPAEEPKEEKTEEPKEEPKAEKTEEKKEA
jgi:hypothetical protein